MMTVVQMRLEPEVRGRVLALWFMAFGGLIPFGNMFFGPLIDRYGSRANAADQFCNRPLSCVAMQHHGSRQKTSPEIKA